MKKSEHQKDVSNSNGNESWVVHLRDWGGYYVTKIAMLAF
jgi:hypothetical protein